MVLVVPEQSQRPYRFGMTLLCVGALFNWLGLADTYSDPVPAIRYIGVGLIAAGASLICMAMCFWMRNIHDPNSNGDYDISSDPIHVISSDPTLEKPPEYASVVDVPPCYEDAIKLGTTPIVFRLKQALTSNAHLINQNAETDRAASKNYADQNYSVTTSLPVPDNQDSCAQAAATAAAADARQMEKIALPGASSQSQNSSQNENTLAKVFRKSIRGIRRFRSGSEDSDNSFGQASNLENGSAQETNYVESTKVDR
ncbi:uncharacterized protein LOC135839615 isoform X2 [Planococcus citri]